MKNTFSILFALILFSCHGSNNEFYKLTSIENSNTTYVLKRDGAIYLPTRYPLPDSVYIQKNYEIAEKDSFIGEENMKLTIFLEGDTLKVPGDTIHIEKEEIKYTTEIAIRDGNMYIISDNILERCQVNLEYKSACLYDGLFRHARSFNNVGLDFTEEKDGRYIYKASLKKWISGSYNELKYAQFIYNEDDRYFSRTSNKVSFSKEDVDSLLKPFKAYLIQK